MIQFDRTYKKYRFPFIVILALVGTVMGCAGTGGYEKRLPDLETKQSPPTKRIPSGELTYSGYAKEVYSVRYLFRQGKWEKVNQSMKSTGKELQKKVSKKENNIDFARQMGKLPLLERGMIYVIAGEYERAIERFSQAEGLMDLEEKETKTEQAGEEVGSTMGEVVTGQRQLEQYESAGFEQVLLLNYESISYMLDGQRKAYNVARRSINVQDRAHERFEEEIQEARDELSKKEKSKKKQQAKRRSKSQAQNVVQRLYNRHEEVATEVPHAFVNPFGHYVAGMINEFDSYRGNYREQSMLDNARISYEKGLELNSNTPVLKRAIKDLKEVQPPPEDARLVHAVVGRGFAPIKKTAHLEIPLGHVRVPIKLPVYEPVSTPIQKVTLETRDGETIRELSTVSNIDSLALRYQKDRAPEQILDITLALVRNVFEAKTFQKLGQLGSMLSEARMDMKTPDTRSWGSLPKDLMAARFYLDQEIRTVKLVTRDAQGNVLAKRTLDVNKQHPDFLYARAIQDEMKVNHSGKLWMNVYK